MGAFPDPNDPLGRWDLPYEQVPNGPAWNGERAGDNLIVDHCTARAMVIDSPPPFGFLPAVGFTFGVGVPGGVPRDLPRILLVGTPASLRQLGRLLRDTCNGAANAAEKAAG